MRRTNVFIALIVSLLPALASAQVKVNALPSGSTPVSADFAICDQSGVTNKCTYSQVATAVSNLLTLGTFATQNYATPPIIGGTTPAAASFSVLTDTGITGSTQCIHVNSAGLFSGTGSDCGSGGSSAFSSLTSGTNTTAAMLVGGGGTLGVTGGGTIGATSVTGFAPASGKTLTVSNSITFTGTDGTSFALPTISGTISTLNTAATYTALQTFGTEISIGGVTAAGATGTSNVVFSTNPTITTPTISGNLTTNITGSTQCVQASSGGVLSGTGSTCGSGGSTAFSGLTTGSNTTATMTVGTGATITVSGSGVNNANEINGAAVAASSVLTGTNGSNQIVPVTTSGCFNVTSTVASVNAPINPQTGTTYAIATTDACKLVTFSNAASVAVSLSVATTSGFGANFAFDVQNLGVGLVTITPTTSTINGATTLTIPTNRGCTITSDGTNYQVSACTAITVTTTAINNVGGAGTSITPSCAVEDNYGTMTATGGTFTVNAATGCTQTEGQKLLLHLKFTNSQTYSWNAAYVGGTTALPTTSTGTSKGDWVGFRWDSINSKWDYLATATGF